jgi:hypothetical protein
MGTPATVSSVAATQSSSRAGAEVIQRNGVALRMVGPALLLPVLAGIAHVASTDWALWLGVAVYAALAAMDRDRVSVIKGLEVIAGIILCSLALVDLGV